MHSDDINRRTFLLGAATLTSGRSRAVAQQSDLSNSQYGSQHPNTRDVYLPKTARAAPFAIVVHGGVWKKQRGSSNDIHPACGLPKGAG